MEPAARAEVLAAAAAAAGYAPLSRLDAAVDNYQDAIDLAADLSVHAGAAIGPDEVLAFVRDSALAVGLARKRIVHATFEERRAAEAGARTRRRLVTKQEVVPTAFPEMPLIWPTRFRQKLAHAEDPDARAKLEQEEIGRWRRELASVLRDVDLPIVKIAAEALDPEAVLLSASGRKRASTIRARLRVWKRVQAWLFTVHHVNWPASVAQMHDVLNDMVAGGCARTAPGGVAAALVFLEKAGGSTSRVASPVHQHGLPRWPRQKRGCPLYKAALSAKSHRVCRRVSSSRSRYTSWMTHAPLINVGWPGCGYSNIGQV